VRFAWANRRPPTWKPPPHVHKPIKRNTFGRLMQARIGHTHLGEYYRDFNIPEDMWRNYPNPHTYIIRMPYIQGTKTPTTRRRTKHHTYGLIRHKRRNRTIHRIPLKNERIRQPQPRMIPTHYSVQCSRIIQNDPQTPNTTHTTTKLRLQNPSTQPHVPPRLPRDENTNDPSRHPK
jgi:hypothetical protein